MRRPADALIAASALAVVVAVVLVDWLMDESRRAPFSVRGADLHAYFVPALAYIRETLGAGDLPLWNPYQMSGSPFLASHQSGALNPLWWPFFLFRPATAVTAIVLLNLWLAGFFTWLFTRRLDVSASAALAAAVAYMLSWWVLNGPFNPCYGSAFAWVPAVFWSIHRLMSDPGPRNAGLLALMIALAFLAGYSQAFFYLAQFATGYAIFWLASPLSAGRRRRATAWACVAGVVGAALCAAQLLPTLELAQQGTRSLEGLSLAEAAIGGRLERKLWTNAWSGGGVFGLHWLTLPLAVAALIGRRRVGHAIFFAASLLVLADFMRGAGGLVFPIHFALPGGDLFRMPNRASFAYAFAAAILIGLGAQRIADRMPRFPAWAAVVSLVITSTIATDRYLAHAPKLSFLPLTRPDALEGPPELVSFARRLGGGSRIFVERLGNGSIPFRMGQMHGFGMLPDYEPLLPGAYRELFGITKVWHGNLTIYRKPRRPWLHVEPSLLDWLSVTHYADASVYPEPLSPEPLRQAVEGRVVVPGPVPIVERRSALPRAFIAEQLDILRDSMTVHDVMLSTPARRTAFVARANAERAGLSPGLPPVHPGDEVEILETAANRTELRATCRAGCFVVLNDLHYPGWRAFVDGREVAVVRTNFLFRGLMMPSGSHRLEFVYRPTSFRLGAGVSLAGVAALLALWWAPRRREASLTLQRDRAWID